jgi:DNA-binding HxlR family transcriptional regulator
LAYAGHMKTYGQFCSISKALEVVGERWSPLILRELMCGSSRFNEIQKGMPRLSPSLLTKRLSDLERGGVIQRTEASGGYELTPAGWELKPVVEALGVWGQRWVRGQLSDEDFDPDILMWDMRRRIDLDVFPAEQTCVCFEFTDIPKEKSLYWLLGSSKGLDLCISDPNFDVNLYVTTDVRTLTLVWNGDLSLSKKVEDGAIDLHGPKHLQNAFQSWLQLNMFAGIEAAH